MEPHESRSGTSQAESIAGSAPQAGIFARNGEYWSVGYGAARFSLKDIKGLSYIERLMQHPGQEFHALDLLTMGAAAVDDASTGKTEALSGAPVSIAGLGDAGEMLDAQAKQAYKLRLADLREQLEELKEGGDHARAIEVESEIDFLAREIARAVGLGGRDRRAGSAAERARLNVTRAIKAALQKISEFNVPLGELLNRSIKTGSFCTYVADPRVPVDWQFSTESSAAIAVEQAEPPLLSRIGAGFPRALAHRTGFVGRQPERGILRRCMERAQAGKGSVVIISGAPGVGKSRLADEFGSEASQNGFLALAGSCYDRDDSAPFIPFVEILETALAQATSPKAFREALGDDAPEIARLMPQLRRLFPDLPPPLEIPPEQSRRLLFKAVAEVLMRTARNRPVLLLLEDLHWADEGTLSLLTNLARLTPKIPVMIVATYRDHELKPGGSLAATLDELTRLHLLQSIALEGLPQSGVAEMIRELSDREPPKTVVDFIYSGTDGNPFFVEELFLHLVERGQIMDIDHHEFRRELKLVEADIPHSVRLVIGRRLARLGDQTRKILGTAAVLGRSFPLELLEASTRMDADSLLDCIEEAEKAGLLSSTLQYREAQFQFSHELIRQAVLGEISAARRQRLHLQIADAIEHFYAGAFDDHSNDLAHHLWQAGNAADVGKTLRYLAVAAKREISQSAYENAIHHLRNALDLVPRLPDPGERDRIELDFLVDYGVTLLVLKGWYVPEMGDVYKRARELCKQLGDTQRLLLVLFGLASFHLCRAELRLSRTYVDEMISLTSVSHDDQMVLTGWSTGAIRFFKGEFSAAHASFQQGMRFYDKHKHKGLAFLVGQDLYVSCVIYDAMTLLVLGLADQAEKRLIESLSLARELGYPFTLAYCLTMAAKYYCMRRDFGRLPDIVRETAVLAHEHEFAFYEEGITAYHIIGLAAEGKPEELKAAFRRSKKFSQVGYQLAHTWARSTLAEALANLGRVNTALPLLTEAFNMMQRNNERYVESEIHRIRGLLMLSQVEGRECTVVEMQSAHAAAEQTFREAKEMARRQGAKLFELRAATSLSRLLIKKGRSGEAERILRETYKSFTEGFDAPDLRAASAILEELSAASERKGVKRGPPPPG